MAGQDELAAAGQVGADLEAQAAPGRLHHVTQAQLAGGPAQHLPPPVLTLLQQQHLTTPAGVTGDGHPGGQHTGVVEHHQVTRTHQPGQVADVEVFRLHPGAPVHQEPGPVTGLHRRLGDGLRGQGVVEVVGAHGAWRGAGSVPGPGVVAQKPMERPMISFMISVVPP